MLFYDSHTHSAVSPDAHDSAAALAEAARKAGLAGLCVTNHCDLPRVWSLPENDTFKASSAEQAEAFASPDLTRWIEDRALVDWAGFRYGVELGSPHADPERAGAVIAELKPDFVIGSIHSLHDMQDFYYLKHGAHNLDAVLEQYFAEMLEMAETGDFDCLGHLTYPWRYLHREGMEPDIRRYEEQIYAVFRVLAERERSMEINTSGLRQPFGRCMPDLDLIKLYKECGGKLLTVGSDAHCADDIGAGLMEGHALAKAAGFTRGVFYTDREPELYEL